MKISMAGFVCGLMLLGTVAQAQDDDKEARVYFEQGLEFYQDEAYDKAAISFARAYELKPTYKLLYNVGQVENQLEHYAAALAAYTGYLEGAQGKKKERKRIAEVEKDVARLKTLVGKLTILSDMDGAVVQVDSVKVGTLPLSEPLVLDMGRREVRVIEGVKEVYREVLVVSGGKELEIEVNRDVVVAAPVEPVEPVVEEAPATTVEKADETKPTRVWTWVVGGIGAATLIAGGVVGGLSMKKQSELDGQCPGGHCPPELEDDLEAGKKLSVTADVLYGVGAVALTAGVLLFFLEPRARKNKERQVSRFSIVPAIGDTNAGVLLQGRF